MKHFKYYCFLLAAFIVACSPSAPKEESHSHAHDEASAKIPLNPAQVSSLQLKLTEVQKQTLSGYVEASGTLEVPPQNEAIVTAIVGANVQRILVIEGEEVKKGQVLAYLTHPEIIRLQSDYITAKSELDFLKEDLDRQETLVEENVGSGKQLQQANAHYLAKKGEATGLEYQLKLLGINPTRVAKGNILEAVPVKSPISGYVQKVNVKTAQFVDPQTNMFEIINVHHVHADLMVFEKDVAKVHIGQRIKFTTEAAQGQMLDATIRTVGKSFEENPKAVHIHADIENKEGFLLPGMYIQGKIIINETAVDVLPIEAVVRDGNTFYAFAFEKGADGNWIFTPQELLVTEQDENFMAVNFISAQPAKQKYAKNNAYYLLAEWKKEEAGHSH